MNFDYQTLRVEREARMAWIYLNRPEKKNSMDPVMHREIRDVLDHLEKDEETRVLVFTGAGDSFCAGLDLEKSFLNTYDDPDKFYEALYDVQKWNVVLRYFPKPTIACVNGYCFAGAFNLLSACDLAIASESATFGISEINFGHIPAGGTTWSVAQFALPKHALYLILTGETFNGAEAARMGLVTKAVPHEKLLDETRALAVKLTQKNPIALRSTKTTYLTTRNLDLADAIRWEMAMLHENTYYTREEWIKQALERFKKHEFKPGLETYRRD